MMSVHLLPIALMAVAVIAAGPGFAASTTNYSDQWWVPSESGWGASVQQQASTLFIDLLIYARDGKPSWFTAAAQQQANAPPEHTVFGGVLYATTGPSFGGPFDPTRVTAREVGTLTFDASAPNNATISYTVDGTPAVKNVTRQTWSYENLTGRYDAVWKTGCGTLTGEWGFTDTTVDHHADNTVTLHVAVWASWYQIEYGLRGSYTQLGHTGGITADFVAPTVGTITVSEIEKTATGFTARLAGTFPTTCQVTNGRVVAVRRQ